MTSPTLRTRLTWWIGGAAGLVGLVAVLATRPAGPVVAGIVASVVVVTLVGHRAVGRALRPLHDLTAAARRLSTDTLDERIDYHGPRDELRALADTLDTMLGRIAESVASQRRFVSNASHELRTPLAVMRTEIDVTLSDPDATVAELRAMGTVVRDACDRANDLIESLLWLARAEAADRQGIPDAEETDLAVVVDEVIDTAQRIADQLDLALAVSSSPAPVYGDPSLLGRVAGNLIENAIRHNDPQGRVWVLTGCDAGRSWLVIGNTGSDVDPDEVPRLFEPFNRGGEARVGRRGAGLGMSIVRAVCRAHGGDVRAESMPDGGGLEVRVELPACSAR